MQSYILGLAEVPFRLYMIVSWICILPWAIGAAVLGKGVFNGNFRLVLYGIGVIVVAVVVVQGDPQTLCPPRQLAWGARIRAPGP